MLPTTKQTNTEYEVLDAGTYQATLKSLDLEINQEYQSTLRYQGIQFTWDIDGSTIVEKFVRVSMNERATFYKRASSLFGRPITEEDSLEWKLSPKANVGLTIDKYKKAEDKTFTHLGELDEGIHGHVDDLLINGESVLGKQCFLNLKVNDAGYNRVESSTPLPKAKAKPQPNTPAQAVGAPS
jgi:hypothetical protein